MGYVYFIIYYQTHSLSMKIRFLLKCCVSKLAKPFTMKHLNNPSTLARN